MPGRYEHLGRSEEARPSAKSTSRCAGATRRPPPASNAACSSPRWRPMPASTPSVRYGARSSGVTSTTMPALAKPSPRLDGDHPLTTTSSPLVAAGQITPPGHMQKENTARPSTWWTRAYEAPGNPHGRVVPRYWIWSISPWGCSTRTPPAKRFAATARPERWRSARTPRVECAVARTTPRRAVAHQHVEHTRDGSPFRRPGVELAVGERAGPPLAEAVVVVRVDDARARDPGDGVTASADVCSALEDDRPEPVLDQRERREQPGGARPHDHGRRCTAHVTESQRRRRLGPERL